MSHSYSLRPTKPRMDRHMERRIEAAVAAFGEENRAAIRAVPSATGQGVHITFDRERSLAPLPATNEDPALPPSADIDYAESSASGTPEPRTPRQAHHTPSSVFRTPRANRRADPQTFREGSEAPSDDGSVADSLASMRERKRVLHGKIKHVRGERIRMQERRSTEPEQPSLKDIHERFINEERVLTQRLAALHEEYHEALRALGTESQDENNLEHPEDEWEAESEYSHASTEIASDVDDAAVGSAWQLQQHHQAGTDARERSLTPRARTAGQLPANARASPAPPPIAGPSRSGPQMMERHQQSRALRRQHAQQIPILDRRRGRNYVVVKRGVPLLGPSGTEVWDEETNEPVITSESLLLPASAVMTVLETEDGMMVEV
ncbi:hypothetical protein BC834DRAFT_971649 [Gloeopeniophorella convolvens]|nr:hypothetical protein BC834DRAFT_971649 [Gloeopeniophorella convolvens]